MNMLESKKKINRWFKIGITLLAVGIILVPTSYAFIEYIKQDAVAEKERFAKERAIEEKQTLEAEHTGEDPYTQYIP